LLQLDQPLAAFRWKPPAVDLSVILYFAASWQPFYFAAGSMKRFKAIVGHVPATSAFAAPANLRRIGACHDFGAWRSNKWFGSDL